MSEEMPRNVIKQAEEPVRDDAAKEAEWLANNVPAGGLELRWRYANRNIQLFERHLRSLANYNVGPALRSYLRTRLEWLGDNKVYQQPEGVIVVTIAENGDVDAYLEQASEAPQLSFGELSSFSGTVWALVEGKLYCSPEVAAMKGACETFAKDLATTLASAQGYEFVGAPFAGELPESAEVFAVSDEFGFVGVANPAALSAKMQACFDKLWSQDKR